MMEDMPTLAVIKAFAPFCQTVVTDECENEVVRTVRDLRSLGDQDQNCKLEQWSAWDTCSEDCSQSRSRGVLKEQMGNGDECEDTEEERECTGGMCPSAGDPCDYESRKECKEHADKCFYNSMSKTCMQIMGDDVGLACEDINDKKQCKGIPECQWSGGCVAAEESGEDSGEDSGETMTQAAYD